MSLKLLWKLQELDLDIEELEDEMKTIRSTRKPGSRGAPGRA